MTRLATIGPPGDPEIYRSPEPKLLRAISRLQPVPKETHVLLSARSVQRLALGHGPRGLVLAMWPAELKRHGEYLYRNGLGVPMVREALSLGWTVEGAPHLAFRNSGAGRRLYLQAVGDAVGYARLFEGDGFDRVGAYSHPDVRAVLWPWLKERGWATDADDSLLEDWLANYLGRREAFFRAGLRMHRSISSSDTQDSLRREVDAILESAGELPL